MNLISAMQIMEVRKPLEVEIVKLAVKRRKKSDIEKMEKAVLDTEININNPDEFVRADNEFHQALVESVHNPVFKIISRSILPLLNYIQKVTVKYLIDQGIKEHKDILNAIKMRNTKAAIKAMEKNMNTTSLCCQA